MINIVEDLNIFVDIDNIESIGVYVCGHILERVEEIRLFYIAFNIK